MIPRAVPSSPRARSAARRGSSLTAFTLVELVIVIGVIALLAGIVLPSVGRARELAKQVGCMSNLRQLGVAFNGYATSGVGTFPFHADVGGQYREDWIHWQAGRDLKQSAVARYLASTSPDTFRCPSDDVMVRPRVLTEPYRYSYTFNYLFAGNGPIRPTLAAVKRPADKLLVVDENETSLDDGNWHPQLVGSGVENFVSVRHDHRPAREGVGYDDERVGHAVFADGHAGAITRRESRDAKRYDPTR
ncbi:MAG TPA: type II secretion system protein [Humisphaera sp.]